MFSVVHLTCLMVTCFQPDVMDEEQTVRVHGGILANLKNLTDKFVNLIILSVLSLPLILMSSCSLLRTGQQY